MKILLIKKGALGDILMTTPLVRQLRRTLPTAQIDYLVGRNYQTILSGNAYLNRILTFDDRSVTRLQPTAVWHCLRLMRSGRYDTIFVLDKHWFFPALAWAAGIPRRIGFWRDQPSRWFLTHRVQYATPRHEVMYYLDLLKSLANVDERDVQMDFVIDDAAQSRAQQALADLKITPPNFVVVVNSGGDNPGESGRVRQLPDELLRSVLNKLSAQLPVVLIGGKNDAAGYQAFARAGKVYNLAGQLSLQASAALMGLAQRVYTTDSGPMHLAAAVGAPITAFFGPTNPVRKAPLTGDIQVLWSDQDIYRESYELYGQIPRGQFFTRLNLNEVVGE